MITKYLTFINESQTNNIKISKKLLDLLNECDNPICKLLLDIRKNKKYLKDNYPSIIDINDNYTQLKYSYDGSSYNNIKISKLFRLFKNVEEVKKNYNITQSTIEKFIGFLKSKISDYVVEVWKEEKILDAFNYNNNIDIKKFGTSCANFHDRKNGYVEPLKSWFDVYVKNPKNIKVLVVVDKNNKKVKARRIIIEGKQIIDSGDFKKGNYYTMLSNYYGEGDSKYDIMLKTYAKNNLKGEIVLNTFSTIRFLKNNHLVNGVFVIKLKETKFKHYPPFDNMYVDFDKNVLTSKGYLNNYVLHQAYKAKYVK